jgi:hypothetical protein
VMNAEPNQFSTALEQQVIVQTLSANLLMR